MLHVFTGVLTTRSSLNIDYTWIQDKNAFDWNVFLHEILSVIRCDWIDTILDIHTPEYSCIDITFIEID